MKRLISWITALVILIGILPQTAVVAQAADTKTIENRYIKFSVNEETGFFSIRTLEGHPQKAGDQNIGLIYEGEGIETSFTTVRIDGEDYVFGQDYGFLGMRTSREASVVDAVSNQLSTTWTIDDIEITQLATLSRTDNTITTGNIGLTYTINNRSGKAHEIGIRLMFDSALATNDAPVVFAGDTQTLEMGEVTLYKEAGQDKRAYSNMIRFADKLTAPKMAAFASFRGWATAVPPDEIKIAHWVSLATSKWDYLTDSGLSFDTGFNPYQTADTAFAVYWNPRTVAHDGEVKLEMLYGIGDFSSEMEKADFNVGIKVNGVLEPNSAKTGYINDIIDIEITIDNSVDNSRDLYGPLVSVMFDEDLVIQKGIEGYMESETFSPGFVGRGSVITARYRLKAKPQTTLKAFPIIVIVQKEPEADEGVSTKRYVVAPSLTGLLPDFKVTNVSPSKVYTGGSKVITVMGDFNTDALVNKTLWRVAVRNTITNQSYPIKSNDITFISKNKLMLLCDEELAVGEYELVFDFWGEYEEPFGKQIVAGKTFEALNDPALANKTYGILAIYGEKNKGKPEDEGFKDRVPDAKYKYEAFQFEEDFKAFQDELPKDSELLLEIRGGIKPVYDMDGVTVTGYSINASNDPVVINRILEYRSDTPMTITRDGKFLNVQGDGKLSIIGSGTIWQWDWKIEFEDQNPFTLTNRSVQLSFTGIGKVLAVVAGFMFDFRYGIFGRDGNSYTINFGGSLTLPIAVKEEEKKEDGSKPSENVSPNPGGSDQKSEKVELPDALKAQKKQKLGITVDDALFGEKSNGDKGFIGINTTVALALPKGSLGGIVENGFEASVTINTLDDIYRLYGKVNIQVLECEAEIVIKMVNVGGKTVPFPDTLFFAAGSKVGIPIAPGGLLAVTKLGGGYAGLADTMIMGADAFPLPPITVRLVAGLKGFYALSASGELKVSPTSLAFDLVFTPDVAEFAKLRLNVSAKWNDPYVLTGGIELDLAGIIKGGGSVTFSLSSNGDFYFSALAYVNVSLPPKVPLIGGRQFLSVKAMLNNDYIGASVEALGIKLGVRYTWATGNAEFLSSFSVSDEAEGPWEEGMVSLSNVTRMQPAGTVRAAAFSPFAANYSSEASESLAGVLHEDMLLSIPFYGSIPDIHDLEFTIDGQTVPLVAPDEQGRGGNCIIDYTSYEEGGVVKQSTDQGQILISVMNPSTSAKGYKLGLKESAASETLLLGMEAYSISRMGNMTSAELKGNADIVNPENNQFEVEIHADQSLQGDRIMVSLIRDKDLFSGITTGVEMDENGEPVVVTYKDGQKIEGDLFGPSDIGAIVYDGTVETADTSFALQATFEDTLPSGEYYVRTVRTSPMGAVDEIISEKSITYHNSNEPQSLVGATIRAAGDGKLAIHVTKPATVDYTDYFVSIYNVTDQQYEQNYTAMLYAYDETEDEIIVGGFDGNILTSDVDQTGNTVVEETKISGLEPGKVYRAEIQTVKQREEDGVMHFSPQTVQTAGVTLPAVYPPVLSGGMLSEYLPREVPGDAGELITQNFVTDNHIVYRVTSNVPVTGDFYVDDMLVASTGDAPGETWVFDEFLQDGAHDIYFRGANSAGDTSVTHRFGFIVDTDAPDIKLDSNIYQTMDGAVTITGFTAPKNKLYFDEVEYPIEVDGSFSVSVNLLPEDYSAEYTLCAESMSGTKTYTPIVIINSNIEPIREIIFKVNNETIAQGEPLFMRIGEVADVKVFGKTASGAERPISDARLTILDGAANATVSSQGALTATDGGTVLLKASYYIGEYLQDDESDRISLGFDSVLEVEVQPKADTPIASLPDGGSVSVGTALELYSGQTIYYTLDGSTPTKDSIKYTSPIIFYAAGTVTVQAVSIAEGYADSDVMTVSYAVIETGGGTPRGDDKSTDWRDYPGGFYGSGGEPGAPVNPDDPYSPIYPPVSESEVKFGTPIQFVTDIPGGVVYYTLDGTTPNKDSLRCDGAIIITANTVLKLTVWTEGDVYTPVLTLLYTVEGYMTKFKENAGSIKFIVGYEDGTFRPDVAITRAETVTILRRVVDMYGYFIRDGIFEDADMWAKDDINTFASAELLKGGDDGRFHPDRHITRAEFVTIIMRILDVRDQKTSDIPDVKGHWAESALAKALEYGFLIGCEDGTVRPDHVLTRAEAVTILSRIFKIEDNPDAQSHFSDVTEDHWAYRYIINCN